MTIGSLVPSLGELESAANAKAAAALGALKAGSNGDQVVTALNLSTVNFAPAARRFRSPCPGCCGRGATMKALPTGTASRSPATPTIPATPTPIWSCRSSAPTPSATN